MADLMERKIAVVGLGALFPDAKDPDEFWQNITAKKVSIKPLPENMLDSEVFYRPDLLTAFYKEDKTTTKVAAWIDDLSFDTVRKYRIPPSVAEHMDANQHAALYVADQALDADALAQVAADRIAVIFGNGMVGTRYGDALARVQFQLVEHYAREHAAFQKLPPADQEELLDHVREVVLATTIPITEDSAPGILPNIIAGRIASVYDFHGPSFTVDAACASVLAAVIRGIQGLRLDEYDAVLCGGADMPLKHLGFVMFSALNALSPDGSFPFDKRANGFVMGQGAGALLLKRLEDAIAHQDNIYCVITGYGEASDGKGKYIAAPNAKWQARTIEKACRMAGYPVDTIEMIEAHGTATKVGDVEEIAGLKEAFASLGATRSGYCGLTSAKSNIGHLKSAAGIAGMVKAVLAIQNKMLPPTASFEEINPKLELEDSPFYVLDELSEWQSTESHPRRANVSSFGFGGADYHIALEEYREQDYSQPLHKGFSADRSIKSIEPHQEAPVDVQPGNLVFFAAKSTPDLDAQIEAFLGDLQEHPGMPFADLCALHNYNISSQENKRLAFLTRSLQELESQIAYFQEHRQSTAGELLSLKGIYYRTGHSLSPDQIAILFPGQASQYPGMFHSIRNTYDIFRDWFQRGDAYWFREHHHTISSLVYPLDTVVDNAAEILKQTQNAHPAIFVSSFAYFQLLTRMGLNARFMVGHSLGEITALAAAGRISPEHALKLVDQRGHAFYRENLPDPGKMISIKASQEEAQGLIEDSGIEVWIANLNSPQQTIIAGSSSNIEQFKEFVDRKAVKNRLLQVSHAFHTPLLGSVADNFYHQIKEIPFATSDVQVMMNHRTTYYPNENQTIKEIPDLLKEQITQPVRFIDAIQKLYRDGVRLFVEVGPGSILSNLVKDILAGEDFKVITTNFKNTDDLISLQKACGSLFAEGVPIQFLPAHQKGRAPITPVVEQAMPGQPGAEEAAASKSIQQTRSGYPASERQVVYSGVAIGLPGSYKKSFQDDNFEQIFAGQNLIERLSDQERQWLVDLQISKLIKNENGPTFKLLTALEDVIQLAGKAGRIDMVADYHVDDKVVRNMTSCIASGVAAGYEALRDAQIPLVRVYRRTTTGNLLPEKLALPEPMQEETGVIFANGFPMVDPIIQEVSRYISYRFGSKTRKELMSFYESIIQRVKDPQAKKLLSDWYTLYYSRLTDNPGEEDLYQFNHHFMTQISAQANNLLAMLINAKGPNFQMNAACSSTSNAITIAEDFIRSGRVKRMIVIGADDPTSATNLPYLGAGFLCTGAATNEADLYKAAVPFDQRRNGMLMGAGAVGIVLETQGELQKRGVSGICELLGTHSFNTARHISQIDAEIFSEEFDKFIGRMEQEHGLDRKQIARDALYISHEPFTPPRGGCSQTEAQALKTAFGDEYREIIIGNSKGMTGHTMGASLEDAIIVKSLQHGRCPPVVNLSETDPMLDGLYLWQGGSHNRSFGVKLSAGFGSQGHIAMLKKLSVGESRISNPEKYQDWLESISPDSGGVTEHLGRILAMYDPKRPGAAAVEFPGKASSQLAAETELSPVPASAPGAVDEVDAAALDMNQVESGVVDIISQLTGYPPEMLEPDMELGSDLGIDSDKRAAIWRALVDHFNLIDGGVALSGEATLAKVVDHVSAALAGSVEEKPGPKGASPLGSDVESMTDREAIAAEVLKVFAEVTKYPEEMLELEMEMEADLGIDTVKQATILSILGERYRMEQQEGMKLSDYPTIRHIVDLFAELEAIRTESAFPGTAETPEISEAEAGSIAGSLQASPLEDPIAAEVLKVFAEVTKYPQEMLELDMEMEADLGIDTVKQATILSILGERYRMEQQEGMKLSDYPTIRHIVDLVKGHGLLTGSLSAREPAEQKIQEQEFDQPGEITDIHRTTSLSRQVVHFSGEALASKEYDLEGKSVWVVGDDENTLNLVAASLQESAAVVSVFVFPDSKDQLEAAAAEFTNELVIDVVIDCTHIGDSVPFSQLTAQDRQALLFLSSDTRFMFYKRLSALEVRPARIICLTSTDGYHGLNRESHQVTDPSYGALSGFYKSLRKEWADSDVRIIDFSEQSLTDDFSGCMSHVLSELQHAGIGVEISYADGIRKVAKIEDKEQPGTEQLTYTEDDTFLITGGGTGIGARIALTIAEAYQPGIILVDLFPLPENIDTLAELDEKGLQKLKEDIHDRLQRTHKRVTPVMLNQEYDSLIRAIEIHNNLKTMRKHNARVVYIPCDVRDLEELGTLLEQARETVGHVTAVIHAAGLDRSHFIDQKSAQEFHDVFSVKAGGANNLFQLCKDDPLRLVVAFSSISGRFGNAAQLDYSAANNYLSNWISMVKHERPEIHALSLVWSGWKDIGMAWRNDLVRQRSEEMGLNLIDVEQGITAFLQEIENKTDDLEVILHRGLDGFLEKGLSMLNIEDFPLIDRVVIKNSQIDRAYRLFSIRRDALIDQHRLGNVPIMPAVGYVELAVEYYALLAGTQEHYILRELNFSHPFKLFRQQPRELFIKGSSEENTDSWAVEILSSFRPPKATVDQIILHSSAVVSRETPDLSGLDPERWDYHESQAHSLPAEESLLLLKSKGPEQRIILGPLYNDVIRESEFKEPVYIYPKGTTYPTYFPLEQTTNEQYPLESVLVNPCFLDSLLQACAANLLVNTHRVYLPWKINELGILHAPTEEGLYRSYAQIINETEEIVSFNVVMLAEDGQICYYARDAQFRLINL